MIRLLPLALPLILSGWNIALGRESVATILLSALGAAAVVYGLDQRRYSTVVGGCFALLVGQVGALVTSATPPQVWTGLLYGGGLLAILELAYDRITLFRGQVSQQLWRQRLKHHAGVAIASVAVAFFVGTLAVGFSGRLPQSTAIIFWVGGVSIVVLAIAAAAIMRFWMGQDSQPGGG